MELRRGHRDKSSLPRDQNLPVNHSRLPPPLPHLTQGAQVWGPQQVTLFRSEQDQNPGGGGLTSQLRGDSKGRVMANAP